MSKKGGMPFEESLKRRGTKMVYLLEPPLNVTVADKYKDDTSYAWIEIARFYYTLSHYQKSKEFAIEHNGDLYYWVSYNLVISRLWHFGIRSKSTVSRALELLCNPSNNNPPLLKRIERIDSNGHKRLYYAKTGCLDDLFSTDIEYSIQSTNEYNTQTDDGESEMFDTQDEIPEQTEETSSALPEWFDAEWDKCLQSGKFQSCSKICSRGKNAGNINRYAEDFAKAVTSISDGTFYNVFGGLVKTKYALPEGLTPSEIVDGVISSVSGIAPNPFAQIIMRTAKTVSSPYLLWYSKQGNKTSPAKKVHPVREAVRVPQEWYNTRKPYKYIWNMPDGRGGTYQGYITDYFLENKVKGIIEKFDPRITAWAVDVIETYALIKDPKVHMPGLNTAIETMLDMAKYKSKQEGGNYLDYFWDIVMSIKIYTDTPLWHWFVKTYGMRSNDCISAIGVSSIIESRKQNEAQFRELLNVIA